MTDYKKLALYYLKAGKRRCIVTIVGVMITVAVLYTALNFGYSYVLQTRQEVRKEADYEIVFLSEDTDRLAQIAADDRVLQAYSGAYSGEEYVSDEERFVEVNYKNALYVNIRHPYQMESVMEAMKADYGVDARLNNELAVLYLQDSDGLLGVVLILVLLVAYIFAIFAVGMIRNTVQMFTLEQVKDYGILRCIGATKGQLNRIIYRMGAGMELTGIAAGVLLGTFVSVILGFLKNVDVGFHIGPVIPILIAYLGDLYFVMQECSKIVTKMSPVSAVRGEYRIKKEKIKIRGNGLMGRLFGIEGAYARKSVLRNSGRFAKTVTAMMLSITATVICLSTWGMVRDTKKNIDDMYGRYLEENQYQSPASIFSDVESIQGEYLPSVEEIKENSLHYYVTETKMVYSARGNLVDPETYYGKLNKDYAEQTSLGSGIEAMMQRWRERNTKEYSEKDDVEYEKAVDSLDSSFISIEGCDQNDLDYLSGFIESGTAALDDDGILVVGGGSVMDYSGSYDDGVTLYDLGKHFDTYDLQVGDTIQLVDYREYKKRYQDAYEKMMAESVLVSSEKDADGEYVSEERATKEGRSTGLEQYVIAERIRQELIVEGYYRTYTVQGVLDFGDQIIPEWADIYMKRDSYFDLTGFDEQDMTGVKYAIDLDSVPISYFDMLSSDLTDVLYGYAYARNVMRYALAFAAFIFILSSVNIINTTAGNLHMRRKELAQLRVLGMSRKRLIHTVMLEGVMATALSNILGFLFGTIFTIYIYEYLSMLLYIKPTIAWWAFGVGFATSALVICGSIYVSLRDLPVDIVDDLKLEE
ncbi:MULTISPECIES: ABC transporter permease [unclassified Clostridium]|uniref:ABC transporter permease n=1 Tax=unclassified Clostridium TaxID=2614128 RepID=UPI000E55621A|nr:MULTISPECIES: ABC transporter permease [unclassified Clostridium]RHP94618.1 ABC transporter permease [Clostridium sp. AM54-37XD]RHP96713.1 ABC transporter permease [Clostridium sp. AM54-14XD]